MVSLSLWYFPVLKTLSLIPSFFCLIFASTDMKMILGGGQADACGGLRAGRVAGTGWAEEPVPQVEMPQRGQFSSFPGSFSPP